MSKLVLSEWHKIWQSRAFILPFGILILLNLIMLPFNLGNKVLSYSGAAYRQIQADLLPLAMPEKGAFLLAELQRIEGIYRIDAIVKVEASQSKPLTQERERYQSDFDAYWELYLSGQYLNYCESIEQEYAFLRQISSEYNTVNGYAQYLENIIGQAEQLTDISIFQNSNNSYIERNADKTAQMYTRLRNVEPGFFPQRGIVTILNYNVSDFLFLALVFFLCVSISRNEKDSGLLRLIRSTKRGRAATAMAKLLSMTSCIFVLTVLFYGINFIYSQTTFGLGNLSAPVQSFAMLQKCPLNVTAGGYILLFLLLKWLAATVIGAWIMCSVYFTKYVLSAYFLAAGVLAAAFCLKTLIPSSSGLVFLRYANLITPFFANEYLGEYQNIDIGGYPFSTAFLTGLTLGILITGLVILYCAEYQKLEVATSHSHFVLARRFSSKHVASSIIRQEAYKLFISNGALGILVIFISINALICYQTGYSVDSSEIYYRQYMDLFEGQLDSEKYALLENENRSFMPLYRLDHAFASGQITIEAYIELKSAYPELQMKQQAFSKVITRYAGLEDVPGRYLVYESGYYKLFGNGTNENQTDALLCCLACAFLFSGFFAIEKGSGMEKVLSSTPLGRTRTVRAKLLICLCTVLILTVVNLIFRYWNVIDTFGLDYLNASLRSLPQYHGSIDIPIFLAMMIQVFTRLIALAAVSTTTLVISYRSANQLLSGVISAAIFCIPILLKPTKASSAIWFSVYPLFDSVVLLQQNIGILLLLFYSVIMSVILFCGITYINTTFAQPSLPR